MQALKSVESCSLVARTRGDIENGFHPGQHAKQTPGAPQQGNTSPYRTAIDPAAYWVSRKTDARLKCSAVCFSFVHRRPLNRISDSDRFSFKTPR